MPTLKAMWGPKGRQVMIQTPAQPTKRYGIGAVNYHSGETVLLIRNRKRRREVAELLEALLEKLVDTPVRGFAYEAAGGVPASFLERGAGLVRSAAQTWRIPVEIVDAEPLGHESWLEAMASATGRLIH